MTNTNGNFEATYFWMESLQKQTAGLFKNIKQLRPSLSNAFTII